MKSVIERFLNKIDVSDDCWEWKACKNNRGYGVFTIKHKNILAHRYIYEYYHGMICPDLTIDHLCRNHACVNPEHLEQVTQRENVLRGFSKQAENAKKTHCIHGHEFTEENTYIRTVGGRACRTCSLYGNRKYRSLNREEYNRINQKNYFKRKMEERVF